MYGNGTHDRRLPWMDLGELRKTIRALLDEHRIDVDWEHLLAEGHRASWDEILAALADGEYALHESVDGRYVATYAEKHFPLAVVVLFEVCEAGEGRRITALTAFHVQRPGRLGRRR